MLGGIDKWVAGFLSLGIFVSIAAIVLSSVQEAVVACSSGTLSGGACVNSTGGFVTATSAQYNITGNALTAVGNVTSQFATAGTLVGLGILALAAIVIVGYFGFSGRKD